MRENQGKDVSPSRSVRFMPLEGTMIVISILLAFSLDAIWDERKRDREADLALVSLRAELSENLIACNDVYQHHFDNAKKLVDFLEMSDEDILDMTDEEATLTYSSFCSPRTFDPLVGTAKSVMNAGSFSILQDHALRKELEVFINLTVDTREDIENMLHFMRISSEYAVSLGGPWGDPNNLDWPGEIIPASSFVDFLTPEELLSLRNDHGYLGRIKVFHGSASWYTFELERLSKHIGKLLEIIEEMIEA